MTAQQIIEKARSYIGIVEEPINKVIFTCLGENMMKDWLVKNG